MICYYHSKDFDGFASAAVIEYAQTKGLVPDGQFIGYDYGQPFEMPENEDVVMVDVSLSMDKMLEIAAKNKSFLWIDHHLSAINDMMEICKVGGRPANFSFHLRTGVAACELVWEYFFQGARAVGNCFSFRYTNNEAVATPRFITLLGEYDTWRNENNEKWENEILPFQWGMREISNSLASFPIHLFAGRNKEIEEIIEKGKSILSYQRKQDESACKNVFFCDFHGYKAVCLNTPHRNSTTFRSVKEEYDIMIPFSFNGTNWTYSLYTTKDIDCSALAKNYGGGGHKQAAGFAHDEFLLNAY